MDALSPRRSRRNSFCSRSHNKDDKNPYSTRGLDKFSALLAELEEKKQKIYSQKGSEDISFVRFVYKDSDDCVPIVVKVKKDKTKSGEIKEEPAENNSQVLDKFPVDNSAAEKEAKLSGSGSDNTMTKLKKSLSFNNIKLNNLRRPSFYLPAAIIMILLFLVFFGRSFAILCTSIGWYIVPQLKGSKTPSPNVRRSMKKKDYVRRLSEKKMVTSHELSSPKPKSSNNNSGALKVQSPERGARGHRKSW